jgi:two-component system sensor kinase FixL
VRRAHSDLEGERKKYFDLYDLAPVGYVILDRLGSIQECNLTAAQFLGQPRRGLKNARFARFVDPARRDEFYRFTKRLFESGGREELELRLSPTGHPAIVAVLSAIGIVDGEGNVNVAQVAITDISARVAAEHWRQRLLDTTQDAVVAIDGSARIMVFNSAAQRIFGYDAAEVIGKKVNMLMAEPYQSEHDHYIEHYQRTGEKRAIGKIREVSARRKNGEIFPIELSITELGESDEPRYAAFIRDVSEKARLQGSLMERARLATIGETASQIAHEIANPINGLSMSVELLERDVLNKIDAGARTTFKRIAGELTRLKALLADFRDLSREPQYRRSPQSLAALVEELCSMQRPVCEAAGIEVEVDIDAGLPMILVDGDRMTQVLLNLCKNAEEAMPQGGKLTLRGFQSGDRVVIEVRDTGEGIPADVDVFQLFKSTKAGGSGTGLVIARQIVTAHHGTLGYTSTVGKCTSFLVSLPALPQNSPVSKAG